MKCINFISNYTLFKCMGVEYHNFPSIDGRIFVINNGEFKICKNVKINSSSLANCIGGDSKSIFVVKKDAKLIIDENVGISNSAIICHNNIWIGKNVYIGNGCKIYDTDFHSICLEKRLDSNDKAKSKPIKINHGAFIGAHSIILKGVMIGENSVIGAGSVVTKNIPPNEVWAGNPARFIKKITEDCK